MHAPTFTAVVVLPTPPFWLAIAYTVPTSCKLAPITVRGFAQRPLAGHAGAPREAPGRIPHLQVQVQVMVRGALEGSHGTHLDAPQAELAGRPQGGLLLILRPPASPVHQRPSQPQQGRRVLEHDRLRGH